MRPTQKPRPMWQQKLISGGRSGLNDLQLTLAAGYAAKLKQGQPITGSDLNVAMAIANRCGTPHRKQNQRVAPWKR